MPIITEDEVDEILYLARANEIEELKAYIPSLYPKYGTQPAWILNQAVDAESGNSALHYASANGHLGAYSFFLFSSPSRAKSMLLIWNNDIEMTDYLLTLLPTPSDLKSFVNKQNLAGNTALHWSALNGHLSLVKRLLAANADASILNFSGHDAVYEAECNDKQEVAEWLLKEALGLEKGIGREGSGSGGVNGEGSSGGAEGEEGDEDIIMRAGDTSSGDVQEAERVADGMKGMDLDAEGGAKQSPGG